MMEESKSRCQTYYRGDEEVNRLRDTDERCFMSAEQETGGVEGSVCLCVRPYVFLSLLLLVCTFSVSARNINDALPQIWIM